jgi:uncharacterized protein (DUF885 family)
MEQGMTPTETVKTFSALSEEFVELFMKYHPVAATGAGIHDYDSQLPDDTAGGLQARAAWLRDLDQRLVATVPWDDLPLEQRVDFGLLRSRIAALRADLEEIKVWQRNPALYPQQALDGVYLLLAREFAPLEERKESILARLLAIPDYFDKVRPGLGRAPELLVEVASEANLSGPAFVDEVVRSLLRRFPGEAERIEHAGERARVGFLRFQEFIDRELKPKAGGELGIGERWMNYKLEREHMLPYTCDTLADLGAQHVARTRDLLEAEAGKLDSRKSWQEVVGEAKHRHPASLKLREAYESEVARARQFVSEKRLISLDADARIEVVDTPVFERHIIPYAAYLPAAPFDAEQTGYYYVTPVDASRPREEQEQQLAGHCLASIPLTTVHEAYPGHHLQLGIANRSGSRLRKLANSDVFAEGWALYCEELMHEHGYYADPVTRLFQLKDLLWRACRVVIDVELHRGRMSYAQAVDYLVENALIERVNAQAEVKRYAMQPTQPMSYLVGKLQILDMRSRAEQRLGSHFNLRSFHDALLSSGTVPLALAAEELENRLA